VLALAGLAAHRDYLSLQWVIAIAAFGGEPQSFGALLWAPLLVGAGYLLGDVLERLLGDLKRIEHWGSPVSRSSVSPWLAGRRR
jgi:membrane protein DedA with SNARE-associated domain